MSRWVAWNTETVQIIVDNELESARVVVNKVPITNDSEGLLLDIERDVLRTAVAHLAQEIRGYR